MEFYILSGALVLCILIINFLAYRLYVMSYYVESLRLDVKNLQHQMWKVDHP